jgi:hypothetical protein
MNKQIHRKDNINAAAYQTVEIFWCSWSAHSVEDLVMHSGAEYQTRPKYQNLQ